MTPPEIFDRNARRLRRGRVSGNGFYTDVMSNDLLERLDCVKRRFTSALIVGAEPRLIDGLAARDIVTTVIEASSGRQGTTIIADEDKFLADPGTYDLILSSGALDSVADLPGALVLLRRALKPDGLLLANFAASPSLTTLRSLVSKVDTIFGTATARFHPQIDVRAAGDLLVRAGFALPVADLETLDVAYSSLDRLTDDLRAAASTNMLAARYPVSRAWFTALNTSFAEMADSSGKTHETLSFITLTGWSPASGQPQPARRGSGSVSLAAALTPKPQAPR